MGTRLIDEVSVESNKHRNPVDYRNTFSGVIKDPKMCRHLLLAPHVPEGGNENYLSFIGYLKKLIMSRETSLQLAAVKGVLSALIDCRSKDKSHCLREEKFIMAKLLDNDFVEFMCEALPYPTTPSAEDLIQAIFGCLALLSGEDEFYHHFHAAYALESVLRTLHFICEALAVEKTLCKELQTLSTGLALIAIILEGSVNKSSVLEGGCKTVEGGSIFERVFKLITKCMSFENPSIKWKSGLVVRSLLNFWHMGKYFNQQAQKVQEYHCKKKLCTPIHITKGEKIKEVKEICRKMSFYHRGVQLIQTRSTIQQSSTLSLQSHINAQDEAYPLNVKEISLILQLIDQSMKELVNFANNILKSDMALDMKLMNQFLLLICQIGKNALRLLPHKMGVDIHEDKIPGGNKVQTLTNFKGSQWEDIFNAVSQSIEGVCATHLVEIEFNKSSHRVYKECLTCLELLYQKKNDSCSPLSHKLAAKGYLTLLPYLLTFDDNCITDYSFEDELCMMKSTCQVVLTHLLAALSKTELSWDDSFSVLSKGLSCLPKSISSWPSVIASHSHQPTATTMIVFSYFYFLSSTRPDVAIPFLMPLVSFMKDIVSIHGDGANGGGIPSPILKALWFSFATSYLSNECPKDPSIKDATHQLMNCILEYHMKHNMKGIKDIFTYHPAILLWAFSSPVTNQWIQLHVVLLWLEGCQSSKSSREVEQLIVSNQDALICLLSIAENGHREVMECAMRTIWSFLQDSPEDRRKEISLSLWEILLYILKRYNAVENDLERERRALNVACMMQLTQATSQSEPNPSTVLRLACLLNSTLAFKRSDLDHSNVKKSLYLLYFSGLQMLQYLLDVSLANEDTRVASSLLSHSGQLKRLEWASNLCPLANHNQNGIACRDHQNADKSSGSYFMEDLNSLAFSILTSLLCVDPHSQASAERISLNSWHFVKSISSNHQDVSISSLKLLNALIQIHVRKTSLVNVPFVQMIDAGINVFVIETFIRMLYLQFLMLCAKMTMKYTQSLIVLADVFRCCVVATVRQEATPSMENYCWEFLNLALQMPDKNFTSHLSKLPWNNSLIHSRLAIVNGNQSALTLNSRSREALGFSKSFLGYLHQWLLTQNHLEYTEWKPYRRSVRKMKLKGVGSIMFRKVLNAIAKALVSDKCGVAGSENGEIPPDCGAELVTQYEKDLPIDLSHSLRKKLSATSKKSKENNILCSYKNLE